MAPRGQRGAPRQGFAVGIELTKRCNFHCVHCFVDAGKPAPYEMSTAELCGVIDEISAFGAETVAWSGGEPLLREDIAALTSHATGLDLAVGLATNGFLATRVRLEELQSAGLGVVQISIDGPDPQRAARYRQGPKQAFGRATRAVEICAELGLATWVCTLLTPATAGDVDEMAHFAKSLGAIGLRYTMWAPIGRAAGQAYDEKQWAEPNMGRFLSYCAQHQDDAAFPIAIDCPTGPLPFRPYMSCGAGTETAYVTAGGDVYACTALMTSDYCVGNARTRPLRQLLASSAMTRVHDERARLEVGGTCSACDLADQCRGGCPGRTIAANGSLAGHHGGAMPACLLRLHASAGALVSPPAAGL